MWIKKDGGGQTRYTRRRQLSKKLSRNSNSRKMMKIMKCILSQRKSAIKLWLLQKKNHMQNYTKSCTLHKEIR